MTVAKALLLGILQGLTEFLPISSSGHLFLGRHLLGLRGPGLAFDLLLHLGTVLAVLIFLRRELAAIVRSFLGRDIPLEAASWGRRDFVLILVSSVPTAAIGLLFHDYVERDVTMGAVGIGYLVLTALLLMSNLRFHHKLDPERIALWEAAAIGIAQGAAILPGLSRSGATISLALVLGIGASRGAKFSFMISLPAILGAALLNLYRGVSVLPGALASATGFFASLGVGYLSLILVERIVVRGRFLRFAPYTLALAAVCFLLARGG